MKKKTAAKSIGAATLRPPGAARQVRFHQLLVAARKQWFIDALSEALSKAEPETLKRQALEYIPPNAQKLLAAAGLRDEYVFPLPAVIELRPSLVGYYRLLLGAPQKSFYCGSTGLGRFKAAEETGTLSSKTAALVPEFCRSMSLELAEMVQQIPKITERDLKELPLLTFGSQLQGSNNTQIGKTAMKEVFVAVKEIVGKYIIEETGARLTLRNSAKRKVFISLSHDPDLCIQEQVEGRIHHRVAIEVKGGTDFSNVHNRAGEAEKSHQKAKRSGFPEFWTIIAKKGLEAFRLSAESPTTNHWFDVTDVLARSGEDWKRLRERVASICGIPLVRG
ncbi:MAG: XcyI family restriction endonuclease [Candidatus Koribacter versatilis]|uniref:XcyI family restriction endonuclease n=1 Tax=Candidatus Korobacter versatilis TaxID=658062 RepID=A0A932ENU9_9BACT|nr:XcyI family restriction endonuclease [Candidatus Koribacter versatilis]